MSTPMTLAEARRILARGDDSDSVRALQAVATVLRFNGISEPKLTYVAEIIEGVIEGMEPKEQP